MSSSFGGGGRGEIRYVISVDDAQAVQKLQGVGQQLQQMGQTGQQATQGLQQLPQTLDQTAQSSDKVTQSQQQMGDSVKQSSMAVKEQEQAQQSFGSVVKQNIQAIVQIGSGIVGLVANYYSLQRVQLQINKLEVTEANQRRMLGVLTRQHAEAVKKYGANSQEALDIENKINILQQKHTNTVDQLNIRQEQANLGMINFGLSIVQTGAGLVQAAGQIKTFTGGIQGADKATKALTASQKLFNIQMSTGNKAMLIITAVLIGLEAAAQAVAHNFMGFRDWLDQAYNSLVRFAPALKPVIDGIWTIGKALTALFTGDLDTLTSMFSQSAAAAPAAVTGIDDVTDAIGESGKAAADTQKEIDDMWKELKKAPNLTSALKIDIDKDKLTKKFLDYLPDSLTKDIKMFIKGRDSVQTIRDSFSETFSLAMDMGITDDKWADNFVKKSVKVLKEKFPNAPGSKELQAVLSATVAGPDTAAQIKALIEKWKLDPKLVIGTENISFGQSTSDWMKSKGVGSINEWAFGKKGDSSSSSSSSGGLLDKLFKDFTPANVKKKVGSLMGAISDTITDPKFWQAIGETALGTLFTIGKSFNKYVMPWLAGIAKVLGDVKFWQALGETALSTLFAIGKSFNKYVTPVLAEIAKTLGDVKFWTALGETALAALFDITKSIGGYVTPVLAEISKTLGDPKFWKALGENVIGLVLAGWETVKDWGKQAMSWINEQFNTQLDNFKKIGAKLGGWIMDGLQSVKPPEGSLLDKALKGEFTLPTSGNNNSGQYYNLSYSGDNEAAVNGAIPKTKEDLMAILGMFGYGGKGIGPNTNIPGTKGIQVPVSYGGDDTGKALSDSTKSMEDLTKANPMDVFARQLVQVTKDLNVFARTIVQVTKDNNVFAKTIVQIIKDINIIAKATVTWIKDNNQLAKTIVTITKDINQYAKATVQETKDINQIARATITWTKDNNQVAKTIVQVTKNLNTMARAVVQTMKDVKSLSSAMNDIPNIKRSITITTNRIGAAQGFEGLVTKPTTFTVAEHSPEYVSVTSERDTKRIMNTNISGKVGGKEQILLQTVNLQIAGTDIINDTNLSRKIKLTVGDKRDRFG